MNMLTAEVKSKIAKQFSRAAVNYDSAAIVQAQIAQEAINAIAHHSPVMLDLGCGTGRHSVSLLKHCQQLIALDLAFGMVSHAKQQHLALSDRIQWLQGDAEHIPLQSNSVDGVFSSMALQWCPEPKGVLSEISRILKPNAEATLTLMCHGSFYELNSSWKQLDNIKHVNRFNTADSWKDAAEQLGLQVNCQTKTYTTWHDDVRQLLASIKTIGANVVLPESGGGAKQSKLVMPMNRHLIKDLQSVYQDLFAVDGQLPLTYQVCYLHCKK